MGNTFREKIPEEGLEEQKPAVADKEPKKGEGKETSAAETTEKSSASTEKPTRKQKKGSLGKVLGGEFFKAQWVSKQWKLVLLIAAYCLLLVSNRYYVEKLSKQKIAVEEDIKYIREQRLQMQKEYQESVKISRIASELDSIGVGLIAGPPYELKVDPKAMKAPSLKKNKIKK